MRIYLDSAPVIYLVEQVAPFHQRLISRLAPPETVLLTSELTRLECRVKPLRLNDQTLLADYDEYFQRGFEQVVELTRKVIDQATWLRAHYQFKTPDALQLASALTLQCDVFLTNDYHLARCQEIVVESLIP